jgi:uncharacterized integral membrane protein
MVKAFLWSTNCKSSKYHFNFIISYSPYALPLFVVIILFYFVGCLVFFFCLLENRNYKNERRHSPFIIIGKCKTICQIIIEY